MSPSAEVTQRATDLLTEMLTAAHFGRDDDLRDAATRTVVEMRRHPILALAIVMGLVTIAHATVDDWSRGLDGGDWAATIARLRTHIERRTR